MIINYLYIRFESRCEMISFRFHNIDIYEKINTDLLLWIYNPLVTQIKLDEYDNDFDGKNIIWCYVTYDMNKFYGCELHDLFLKYELTKKNN